MAPPKSSITLAPPRLLIIAAPPWPPFPTVSSGLAVPRTVSGSPTHPASPLSGGPRDPPLLLHRLHHGSSSFWVAPPASGPSFFRLHWSPLSLRCSASAMDFWDYGSALSLQPFQLYSFPPTSPQCPLTMAPPKSSITLAPPWLLVTTAPPWPPFPTVSSGLAVPRTASGSPTRPASPPIWVAKGLSLLQSPMVSSAVGSPVVSSLPLPPQDPHPPSTYVVSLTVPRGAYQEGP
ncbi:hypothetical protein DPX16_6451 [Anabarilius grahami]|uniref:Uncharacterized protein n=1 Tax=Anabarilius grahami TaxID=495550 RepID=A0A3N0YN09_ANAGA|nr:hypothetical protein DPX16_6451 [Anabarilius grahami]